MSSKRKIIKFYDFSAFSVPVVIIPEDYDFHSDDKESARDNLTALLGGCSIVKIISGDNVSHFLWESNVSQKFYDAGFWTLEYYSEMNSNDPLWYRYITKPVKFELTASDILRGRFLEKHHETFAEYNEYCKSGAYAGFIFTGMSWEKFREEMDNTIELSGRDFLKSEGWSKPEASEEPVNEEELGLPFIVSDNGYPFK